MSFTEEELQFIINVLANVQVSMKDPNASISIQKGQTIINKASKLIDELHIQADKPTEPTA